MNNKQKLKRFMALFTPQSKVLVVINADPDAISSAMVIKRLLWRKVNLVTIAHFNTITRPDNQTMIELVESGLTNLDRIDKDDYDRFVVVDSQPGHNESFSGINFNAVIDHHPDSSPSADFVDIRPEYGACATLMIEYLKAAKIKPSAKLAAALMLGIKTDTADFIRQAGLKDLKAFQYLYQYADINIVIKVQRALLTQEDLDFLALAIRQRQIVNNRAYFHRGRMEKPDELVMVADFFLGIAGVNWAVVSAVCGKKLVVILRNDGLRKSAGNTAKEAFEPFGSAGGHKTMARAELDLSRIRKETGSIARKKIADWIMSRVEDTAGKKID